MSQLKLSGDASGTGIVTVAAPNTNNTYTVTLPAAAGTLARTDAAQTFTGTQTFSSDASVNGLTVGRGAGAVSTNTVVGAGSLNGASQTGTYNTVIGYQAATANTTGNSFVAIGPLTFAANTTGTDGVAIGSGALATNTTGTSNTGVGRVALYSNTTGAYNTAYGSNALYSNTTASNNTAVGYQALYNVLPATISVSAGALTNGVEYTITGLGTVNWTSIGAASATVGVKFTYNNVAITGSGGSVTQNVNAANTAIGYGSGSAITTGTKNTIIGAYTGNQGGLDIRTASNNIVLSDGDGNPRASCNNAGAWYFYNTGGAGSDVVNSYSGAAAGTGRSLYTGWYGATSPTAGTLSFNVTTNGNVTNTNNSYGAISDIKLKENIVDASPKLDDMMRVRIVNFNFKSGQTHKQIGVIAQELEQVFPGMVEEAPDTDIDGNDLGTTTKQVKYSVFVPMLVKTIQELKFELDTVKAELAALKGA